MSVNAPAAGRITELLANEEDTVTVGQDLFRIAPGEPDGSSASSAAASSEAAPPQEAEPKAAPKEQPSPPPAQPSKVEVRETSKPAPAAKNEGKQQPTPSVATAASVSFSRNENRVKMSRMRLRIAERLKESQNTAAFLTTFNEIDMSSLMEMRKRYKDEVLKQHEVKLGFMSAFSRACTLALKEIPAANASIEVRIPLFPLCPPFRCFTPTERDI